MRSPCSSLGYTVNEALEEIAFRPAAAAEATELGVEERTPVIALSRTCLSADEIPFEASVMVMIAEGRLLRYRLVTG
ncbi:UTRA domain-containing protein [Sinosporangium album]|uniref:UTRA domain-containing protein n=1 Tax=Sinosporangium album TaxID=504805 RepID=UPI003B8349AA